MCGSSCCLWRLCFPVTSTSLVACPVTRTPGDNTVPQHRPPPTQPQQSLTSELFINGFILSPASRQPCSCQHLCTCTRVTTGCEPPPYHPVAHSPTVRHIGFRSKEVGVTMAWVHTVPDAHAVYNLIHTSVFLIDCPAQILTGGGPNGERKIVFLVLSGQLIRFYLHPDVVKHWAQVWALSRQ